MGKPEYMELEAILRVDGSGGGEMYICRLPTDEEPIEDLTSDEAYERCMTYLEGIHKCEDTE